MRLRLQPLVVCLLAVALGMSDTGVTQSTWYRGNVHVHTNRSDGRSAPEDVIAWYRDRAYDFVVLSDHDIQSVTPALVREFELPGTFLVLPGVEVSDRVGPRPVHLNGLGVRDAVQPQGGNSVAEAIERNAAAIGRAGGLAVLNHPNGVLRLAISAGDIVSGGVSHFEVCCADYRGGSGFPATDEIWDAALRSGHVLYGIAADDAHDFGPDSRDPGSAWVMVRAPSLDRAAVLHALRVGDFYATTGVELRDVVVTDNALCLEIDGEDGYGYRTHFLSANGALRIDESANPCQSLDAIALYVRARVDRSDGAVAWVQPVFRQLPP